MNGSNLQKTIDSYEYLEDWFEWLDENVGLGAIKGGSEAADCLEQIRCHLFGISYEDKTEF